MSKQRWAIYGQTKIPISADDTLAEVREEMSRYYPELKTAEVVEDLEGNVTFKIAAGSKG